MRMNGSSKAHPPTIAICGGGNAGHALCIVASENFDGDVTWLVGSDEKAALLREGVFSREGLRATGVVSGRASRVRSISADPAQVIPQANVILIAAPAFMHAEILKKIAPHLRDDALIGSLPTRGGFEFEAYKYISGLHPNGRRRVFGLQTLPWSTRVQEPGRVANFGSIKAKVLMATLPAVYGSQLASQLSRLFGTRIVPSPNFLNMTLGNPGQVIHPGLMYGLFSTWSGRAYAQDEVPLFYKHASDETGIFVEQLSREVMAVARRIETSSDARVDLSGVVFIHEWLRTTYPTQTEDFRTVATCFRTGPLQARKAPMTELKPGVFVPNFAYRYLSEDVPFGLAIVRAIAELAHVRTPTIDQLLGWAQERLDVEYLTGEGLCGSDTHALPTPQNVGIRNLNELIDWYAGVPAAAAEGAGI